jgi:hypothetical protein
MKAFWAIVIAILVIGGAYWLFMRDDANTMGENSTSTAEQTGTTTLETRNMVTLAENEPGSTATIRSATLTRSGFVGLFVVSTSTDDELQTELRGSSRFLTAGTYNDLAVDLSSSVDRNDTLIAVLFADNGNGVFNAGGVDPYLGNSNLPIISDADVVGVAAADEPEILNQQVELYIDNATSTP